MNSRRATPLFLVLLLSGFWSLRAEEKFPVHESWGRLWVRTRAPIPEEVSNESQARALSRNAAIVLGQDALLTYVLQMKTHSKKTLADAEIPSIELQRSVRSTVKGARVAKTEWIKKDCWVTLTLDKSQLKSFLRKN